MPSSRISSNSFWLVGLFSYAVFLSAAAPVLYAGDAGELITASYLLGNAHPPGYPLYLLVGKIASLLPLGSIAWRLNFLNAFLGGVSISLFYFLGGRYLTRSFALICAMLAISSASFFYHSLFSEVYHVQLFIFLLLLLFWQSGGRQPLRLIGLLFGLGLVAHYGTLLLFLGLSLFIVWSMRKETRQLKQYLVGAILIFLGLAVFGYLPLRAVKASGLNWGNPVNISSLVDKLTRSEYGELGSRHTILDYLKQLGYTVNFFFLQDFGLLYLLIIPGLLYFYLNYRLSLYALVSVVVTYTLLATYFLDYQVIALARNLGPKFFIPLYFIIVLFMGAGLQYVISKNRLRLTRYLLTIFTLLTALSFISYQLHQKGLRNNTLYHDYAVDLLNTIPVKARLMTRGDNPLFAALYQQKVLNRRPDVVITATEGNIFPDEYGYKYLATPQLKAIESQIISHYRGPVFYTGFSPDLPLEPYPLLYRLQRRGEKTNDSDNIVKYLHTQKPTKNPSEMMTTVMLANRFINYAYFVKEKGGLTDHYLDQVAAMGWDYPVTMEQLGEFYLDDGNYERALKIYLRAVELEPRSYEAYNDLGLVYKHLGDFKAAITSYKKAVFLNPDFALAHYNLAVMYLERNEVESALIASDRAYKVYPGYRNNLYLRGIMFQRLGNNEQSRKYFEQFIKSAPGPDAWTNKAQEILQEL